MKIRIQEGNYGSLGAYIKDQTLFLTLEGEREDDCAILFYEQGTEEVVRQICLAAGDKGENE